MKFQLHVGIIIHRLKINTKPVKMECKVFLNDLAFKRGNSDRICLHQSFWSQKLRRLSRLYFTLNLHLSTQAHIKFPVDYPYSPPTFRFLTKMWHPNIYEVKHFVSHWVFPHTVLLEIFLCQFSIWWSSSCFFHQCCTVYFLLFTEWRCVHLHPAPPCRWPSERGASLREVEPYPECQVSAVSKPLLLCAPEALLQQRHDVVLGTEQRGHIGLPSSVHKSGCNRSDRPQNLNGKQWNWNVCI